MVLHKKKDKQIFVYPFFLSFNFQLFNLNLQHKQHNATNEIL